MIPYQYQYVPVTGTLDDRWKRQLFSTQYYSGCEAHIYLNGQLMAECKSLQCELSEKVMPLYGYNSYTALGWARGNRIVQGMFIVNMTGMNYLEDIIRSEIPSYRKSTQRMDEQIVDYKKKNNKVDSNIFNSQKNKYWNRKIIPTGDEVISRQGYRSSKMEIEYDLRSKPFFSKESFNIYIVYRLDEIPISDEARLHLQSVDDINLTSMSLRLDITGKPVEQVYTFLAGDWNREQRKLY